MTRSICFAVAFAATATACGGAETPPPPAEPAAVVETDVKPAEEVAPAPEPGALPVDFPRQEVLNVEVGQKVLGIDPYRLDDARKGTMFGMTYTNFTVVEAGKYESKVTRVSPTTIPNAMIIPLRKGETVAKGDIVLTWWQTGGGQQHAIVTGGTPTAPMVKYITLAETVDDAKKEHPLEADSFNKLGADWELGSNVAYKVEGGHKWGQLLNVSGDKLLVLEGGTTLAVVAKADAKPIPVKPELKKGSSCFGPFMEKMGPASVVDLDDKNGRVTLQLDYGSKAEVTVPVTQVALALP